MISPGLPGRSTFSSRGLPTCSASALIRPAVLGAFCPAYPVNHQRALQLPAALEAPLSVKTDSAAASLSFLYSILLAGAEPYRLDTPEALSIHLCLLRKPCIDASNM